MNNLFFPNLSNPSLFRKPSLLCAAEMKHQNIQLHDWNTRVLSQQNALFRSWMLSSEIQLGTIGPLGILCTWSRPSISEQKTRHFSAEFTIIRLRILQLWIDIYIYTYRINEHFWTLVTINNHGSIPSSYIYIYVYIYIQYTLYIYVIKS